MLVTKLALHGPNDSGDTRQESPNRQGEHQISSVRKDRRGEILISFGSKLTVLGGINPPTVQTTERINMPQCRESSGQHEVSIYSNSVLLLRGK
ncbi:MAG: hypothetical protein J07HQX50_01273 [Haloquadratum sp. J07HQX50]|nr:MAG: hypothetical protein J07HQX50_01273 [Haloquadratum sp. J07HQX50]